MLSAPLLLATCAIALLWLAARALRDGARRWAQLAGERTAGDLAGLFVFVPARRLLLFTGCGAVAVIVAGLIGGLRWPVVVMLALACLLVPRWVVQVLRLRWRSRLAGQLPDALALWAGLLRAGQGTTQALTQVASRQSAPLGHELNLMLAQLRMGMALDSAVAGLRQRAALSDLGLLATLLTAHRELGGNLAEPLQRLAELLRGRLLMQARIRSLTAQGRLQGFVVGVLPLLLLAALQVMEPDAMRPLYATWQGWVALGVIALLELLGFVLIRRIVRIDV
jgi:tight adherence protein B